MRVLMLSWEYEPKVIGGLGRHVTALSQALAGEGVEVSVVVNANEGPPLEARGPLTVRRVREHVPSALSFCESVAQANTVLLEGILSELAAGRRFDLVHAHDWLTAYAARAAKHGLGLPLVVTIHATEWGRNGGLFDDRQRHISDVEWWLTFEAWRVICCSAAMRGEVMGIFQVPPDKIRVIPNGVHLPEAGPRGGELRGGRGESRHLLYVGRLVYEKGVDLLLEAFRRVSAVHPDAVLVVAGTGPEEGRLQSLAQHLGIGDRVRFLGYISDEARNTLYRTAAAAVVPSRYEPFGIVALEAMAHGAPLVAARTGGLAEVVDHGRTGLLFAPGDASDLAAQLLTLLASPSFGDRLAASARAAVAARFDWRQIARQTLAVYREVVGEAAGAGAVRRGEDGAARP